MAEKRGEIEKLRNDFNTAGVLEIYLNNEKWYRVTSKDFRSFDGQRRITEPTDCKIGTVVVPMETFEYWGPVFLFGTNKEVAFTNSGSLHTGKIWKDRQKIYEQRK